MGPRCVCRELRLITVGLKTKKPSLRSPTGGNLTLGIGLQFPLTTRGAERGTLCQYWRRNSMSKVALVIGLASTLSFPAFAEDQMLDGTYRLVSSTRKLLESGQVVDTFGKHPTGYINYGKDGRFLVLIVWDKNDRPAPEKNVQVRN